jgi:hypothetical protein
VIAPGDLVFSRWRSPPCASDYEVDIVKGEARLSGGFDTWTGMALVVAVIAPEAKGLCGTGLICLFLPKSQRFVFTWASSAWEGPP